MAFFNNFNIGFRKFIGLSGSIDTGCGDFSYVYSLGGYMDYYQSIAPLADAIDKVASPASCIRPYAFINNVVSQVDENNFLKWLRYPNQTQTGIKFRKEGFEHYLITGNNFIEVAYEIEKSGKKVISYKNLNPRYITVKLDNNNEVEYYEYHKASLPAKRYEKQLDSTNFKINSNRFRYKSGKTYYDLVVWQDSVFNTYNGKDFPINGLGKSKLQSLQDEMLLYQDGNKSNKATFKNSLTAKKMLVIDLAKLPAGTTQEQMQEYKKKLVDEYSGSQNSGKTVITTLDVKPVDLQNPFMARDLEFNIGLRRLRVAFYNAYNIPLPLVEGEFTSNSNMKESNLNLYDSAVLPLLEDYFEFVYVYLIKDFDDKTKIESINYIGSEIPAIAMREAELVNQLSNANIVTKNELRQRIGLGAITGLNAVYVDGNQAPIGEDTNTGDTIGAPLSQVKELVFEDIDDYEIELLESEEKALSDIDLKPTESMANNARRGLELREKFGRGGTAVGVARARDISNRKNLSPSTVGRMVSFFARHGVNEGKNKLPNGDPSNHYIAWLLWGGNSGRTWANAKWKAIKREREK